jgi:hypothetical protein
MHDETFAQKIVTKLKALGYKEGPPPFMEGDLQATYWLTRGDFRVGVYLVWGGVSVEWALGQKVVVKRISEVPELEQVYLAGLVPEYVARVESELIRARAA